MGPYDLPVVGGNTAISDASNLNSSQSTLAWMVQPNQITSGTLSGTTDIGVNGQGVVISGSQSSIVINDPNTTNAVISLLGAKGYILIADPSTGVNVIIIGALPDGTYGMVVAQPGVDVLTLFS